MSPAALDAIRRAPAHEFDAVTLAVLGIPVRFESNSPGVLVVAREAFGAWPLSAAPGDGDGAPAVQVRIHVNAGDEGSVRPIPIAHDISQPGRLIVSTPRSRAHADAAGRAAVAEVTDELVRERLMFRREVLEALALFIVTRMDRQPVHAAAVMRDETALLLAGPSGTGKSTTCYAAVRAGLRLLSEDTVFLQRHPFAVWGRPERLHLTPDSARFFPELASAQPVAMPNGKMKLIVDVRAIPEAARAARAGICLMERGPAPRVERIAPDDAVAALTSALDPGFDAFAGTVGKRLRSVAEGGAWRMVLPPHPADAIPFLHRMFDEMGAQTRPSHVSLG